MVIYSPLPGVNLSVIADNAGPIMSAILSNQAIVVVFDQIVSVFASARSESATLHRASNRWSD